MRRQPTPEELQARRELIIAFALNTFRQKGFRVVTMDDISQPLKMSKRTLYQLFAEKEDLIIACLEQQVRSDQEQLSARVKSSNNVLEALLYELESHIERLHGCSMAFFTDIEYYPKVQRHMEGLHQEQIAMYHTYMEQGVAQGLFRQELNIDFALRMLWAQNMQLCTNKVMRTIQPSEFLINVCGIFLRGCATFEGIALIDRFLAHYVQQGTARKT